MTTFLRIPAKRRRFGRSKPPMIRITVTAALAARPHGVQAGQTRETVNSVRCWPFADAPPVLQAVSSGGGDEEWLLVGPAHNEALIETARRLSGPRGYDSYGHTFDGKDCQVVVTHKG